MKPTPDDYSPPQSVVDEWAKNCDCCPSCNQQIPCAGVMAGGMCDQACDCDDELEDEDLTCYECNGRGHNIEGRTCPVCEGQCFLNY